MNSLIYKMKDRSRDNSFLSIFSVQLSKVNNGIVVQWMNECNGRKNVLKVFLIFAKYIVNELQKLKDVIWGSSQMPPRPEWMKQGLLFHPYERTFAYGLDTPSNSTKNFMMCFQAYLLKQLLFASNQKSKDKAGSGSYSR